MLKEVELTFIPQMSLAAGKQRHKYHRPNSARNKKVLAINLLGDESEQFLEDRKSFEFEKALDRLR